MSVLETPRIYFRGRMAWDPITTNNYPARYDEAVAEPLFAEAQNVAGYRQQAIADVRPEISSWNPHGTHRSSLYETAITGADLGTGCVTDDPFLGAPAQFTGMLVDSEPYGAYSSQLFFDTLTFGIDGGYRILLPRTDRVTARYINFARYPGGKTAMIAGIASVNWQTSFPKADGLAIDPYDSPSLQALAKALESPDVAGLVVRWNAYRTFYYDEENLTKYDPENPKEYSPAYEAATKALIAKLESGGWQPNPARSRIVGTIGLWRPWEPAHEPVGRALIPAGNSNAPYVATAHARLSQNELTIDLSNSISETGPDLAKANLGPLHIAAVDSATGKSTPLATLQTADYDREAYERTCGLVVVEVDPAAAAAAADADIHVYNDAGLCLLQEQALRAIPTTPNLYINESDNVTPGVQVFSRGVPAGAGVTVQVVGAPSTSVYATAQTAADGTASFPYTGPQYGAVEGFILLAGTGAPIPPQIDTQATPYMYIRTLPLDGPTGELDPTWENVYVNVLSKWHAMAPCMDNWLDLGDEAQVRAYRGVLTRLTDPAGFESFRYMPVTRDMTKGERTLLYNFLGVDAPAPATKALAASEQARQAATPSATLDALSKSMRTG